MGKKVFVSYKYKDDHVASLHGYKLEDGSYTARSYVNYLQDQKFSGDDLNKAESDNEDLSQFKDDTIKSKLRDKIWDSSITLVLISPKMKDYDKPEDDQWIPWEVAYSLRTETRNNQRSLPNGMIAVVLPDRSGSYDYFVTYETLTDDDGEENDVRTLHTDKTFNIVRKNMFNQKNPTTSIMQGRTIYFGECSYIITATWKDFINDPDHYLDRAANLKENKIDEYDLHKEP